MMPCRILIYIGVWHSMCKVLSILNGPEPDESCNLAPVLCPVSDFLPPWLAVMWSGDLWPNGLDVSVS